MRSKAETCTKFFTAAAVADFLGVHRIIVYDFVRKGVLPAYRIGPRRLRFWETDVDRFVAAHRIPPVAKTSSKGASA